ncbi:MAG: hypothetical protein HY721_21380 [Planctomycetes bacterium]|nr:hypothetical protein [Planctomycetota bacterium]
MDSKRRDVGRGRGSWKRAGSKLGLAVLLLAPSLGAAVSGRVTECSGTAGVPEPAIVTSVEPSALTTAGVTLSTLRA